MGTDDHETHLAVLTVLPPETTDTDERRIHAIGTDHFTLLEGTLPEDATVAPGERVTPTDDHQGPTTTITQRPTYNTLSQDAQDRLKSTIESIILANENGLSTTITTLSPSACGDTNSISSQVSLRTSARRAHPSGSGSGSAASDLAVGNRFYRPFM